MLFHSTFMSLSFPGQLFQKESMEVITEFLPIRGHISPVCLGTNSRGVNRDKNRVSFCAIKWIIAVTVLKVSEKENERTSMVVLGKGKGMDF